jgi:small subunit ribosomal protein S14
MAKKGIIQRQIRRENLVRRYSEVRQELKKELKLAKSFKAKMDLHTRLQKLPRDSSKTRLRNRCWKTGRGRSVFRDFGLCRIVVRDMANQGFLPGVIKSSW